MRLQWSEIRARAAAFAEKHRATRYEKGDTHTFYNEFFDCFGVSRGQVANYEQRVRNLAGDKHGFMDLFWPGTLIVEQKSAGLDLKKASDQALNYYDWLPEAQRPRYILTCDFQRWHLLDLESGREWRFLLAELKDYVEAFAFILGVQPRLNRRQSAANEKASRLMGQLHEALAVSGYDGHDLEVMLVRLLFVLFADDTRIFNNKDQFLDLIERRTSADGRDLGDWLMRLFEVLNTPSDKRQSTLDEDLADFPYINGALFAERIAPASFDNAMRSILIDASEFDWGEVSPVIFGSLFESVIDKVSRRKKGAHYTPEVAILRLIGPLFLDELTAEFERCKALKSGRDEALVRFHDRLAGLTFLDPACGAGNFLVVTYRELRELEREIIKERFARAGRKPDVDDVAKLSKLNVDQFFGIEIDEFPARIAEVALWMTDHIANTLLGNDFGVSIPRIPLVASPGIRHGDALEVDWNDVLPAARCSYVMGNPPFAGKKEQSPLQKAQVRAVFNKARGSGDLDYVSAWYEKGAAYISNNNDTKVAFVSTNSITQGEQVSILWRRLIYLHKVQIEFAHRTFEWHSPTKNSANVHVVIIGFGISPTNRLRLRLFDYPDIRDEPTELSASHINPYLMDFKDVFVESANEALTPRPKMSKGSEATDFGFLTVAASDRLAMLGSAGFNPSWLKPFVGGKEFIQDIPRFCLWLKNAEPSKVMNCAAVLARLKMVTEARVVSPKPRTRMWSKQPSLFTEDRQPSQPYLLVPKVSSSQREYVPIGFCEPDVIVSGSAQFIEGRDYFAFGVITSAMHMAWLRTVGGRTKSDYQYTVGPVYNTFPWPDASLVQCKKIEALARSVLAARALPKNATSSLADMYDSNAPAAELRKAHRELDVAVDKLYRARPFGSDRERVEHLFPLYEALVQPTSVAAKANKRTARRTARVPK